MRHVLLTRFSYSDEDLFKKRLKVFSSTLLTSVKNQKQKNFTWCILAKEHHRKSIQDLSSKEILFLNNKSEFIDYVNKNNFDIQTRHDSDDIMRLDYIELIQKDYFKNKDFGKPFLIHFQPIKMDYFTKKTYEMRNYERGKSTSAFISLCPMGSNKTILDHWHTRWVGNVDLIVRNKTKNCVIATVHDNNTSTKIRKEDKPVK